MAIIFWTGVWQRPTTGTLSLSRMKNFVRTLVLCILAIVFVFVRQLRFAVAEQSLGAGFRFELQRVLFTVSVERRWSRAHPGVLV